MASKTLFVILPILLVSLTGYSQDLDSPSPRVLYQRLQTFELQNQAVRVQGLSLKRDRLQLTLTGDLYFAKPIAGIVYGAVFLGEGRLQTEPSTVFERASLERFLKSEVVDATFSEAVLRFSDDTYQRLKTDTVSVGSKWERAQKLADELEGRLVRESGLNLSARLAQAVINGDQPGIFFGRFDGGKPKPFYTLLDHQGRVPGNVFGIDGGEKGLLFQYRGSVYGNDVWTAFYNEEDFSRGEVHYSDAFDLIEITDYRMEVDLRDPDDWLRARVEVELTALRDGIRMVPMKLNEGLGEVDKERLEKGLRVVSATLAEGTVVDVIQEDWETGLSLLLPSRMQKNEKVTVQLGLEGKDALWSWEGLLHYPRSMTTWYPRHGNLKRSNFDLTFRHKKDQMVVSVGSRVKEDLAPDGKEERVTQWVTSEPVSFVAFAVGRLERHVENAEVASEKVPIELYTLPGGHQSSGYGRVKEDFVLAELINGLHYFSSLYGDYSYSRLGAVHYPLPVGRGFPSLLFLPVRGYARKHEFAFIAHEGAHQWWGNMVAWRSYRDQWLSEGFAEYSGVLYAGFREKPKVRVELVEEMRKSLLDAPKTDTGVAGGKLYEVGPLVLGRRLATRRSQGSYTTLIYNKGALVLRMLHFLLSNPADGNDEGFFRMMKDFVEQHHGGWATTEGFWEIASRHFSRSPIGRKFGLKDLNWFFHQWVYRTPLPNYRLLYRVEPRSNGGVLLTGTLSQEGTPDDWLTIVPLVAEFSGNRQARVAVHVLGSETPFKLAFPEKPKQVKLDPDMWILSEKTSEVEIKR